MTSFLPPPAERRRTWFVVTIVALIAVAFGIRWSHDADPSSTSTEPEDPSAHAPSVKSSLPALQIDALPSPTLDPSLGIPARALSASDAAAAQVAILGEEAGATSIDLARGDAAAAPEGGGSGGDGASGDPASGEDLPLPIGAMIPAGQGMLEVQAQGRSAIFIDGAEMGRGPVLRLALGPGVHEVRVRAHGEERIRFVMIRAARQTRLALAASCGR
jgi:hypothetical protein